MAGLACAEQVAHPWQRLVGTQPGRLVEQQDAVEAAEPGTRRFAHAGIVDACALVGAAPAASFAGHAKDKGSVGWVDRKSVVQGESVSVRVDLGGRSIIKNKNKKHKTIK